MTLQSNKLEIFLNKDINFKSYLAGPAMIVSDTISFIKNDVLIFGCLTFLMFFVLLIMFFKDFWSAFIIMSNASLVIYLTISLLGYFDWPISIVSSNFLALLFISSVAVSVHMIVKLREGRANNLADEESLAKNFYTLPLHRLNDNGRFLITFTKQYPTSN